MEYPSESTLKIRLWGSLNVFLAPRRRYKVFSYIVKGHPAVKDTLEAVGVPHTEIDCILMNGQAVDFSYQLRDRDRLEAYPYGYPLKKRNIRHLCPRQPVCPSFVLDSHLGKLARHLRLLGFDAVYRKLFPDAEILKTALQEKRFVLTRDLGLLKNKRLRRGYWLRSTDPARQIREVLKSFRLYSRIRPFRRCLRCNGTIVKISRRAALPLLPSKTKKYFRTFYRCRVCRQIYWQGSHYDHLCRFIRRLKKFD